MLAAAVAIAAAAAAPAHAQVSIAERLSLSGTVEAVAGNRVTLRDDAGTRHEVRVQRGDEQGVPLADGRLLAFPAEVRIGGVVEPAKLKPGQLVRFRTRLTARGTVDGTAAEIAVVDAADATVGVAWPHGPPEGKAAADCVVTAGVMRAGKTRLAVELPAGQPFPKRTVIACTLPDGVTATLESRELKRLEPGATVSRLEAVKLDTGDVVARSLVAENPSARGVADRGDDALENRYRGLSDVPPSEPRLVRSPHFAFMTDISDREWAVIRDKLERMVGILERFFGRKAGGVVGGFIVRDLAGWPAGLLQEPLGPARRAELYSCADHGVIQHECVHGFCHLTFGSTGPTWLSEGVAELGNYWRDGDPAVAIDPVVLGYLQNAPQKRSLGEIAVPGDEPAGSWQDYAWRWALCFLLANNPNYSDRFRPLAVALMEQRPGASFEATYGPVAREVSFEYDRLLATVGNGYRADLAAWPWKAAFRTLAAGGSQRTRVKAAAGWQATGVMVERGGAYEIVAEGTWRTAPAAAPLTADGDAAGHGRLVATIFHDFALEPELPLGMTGEFTATTDGRLFLRCADDWTQLGDNDGELDVTIRRR